MIDSIIKRDGRQVPFDSQKISDAIMKAFQASKSAKTYATVENLTHRVLEELEKNEDIGIPTVEEVQDTVERVLIENGFVRTAKSYILYRAERSRVREMNTRLMRIYDDITNKAAIDSDIKRENANINGDTAMGAMLKYGSEGAKQFNLMNILKPEHAEAHSCGDIHIHDMDFLTLTTTCCQIDLISLFHNGFSTGHGYLREPNDIYSYLRAGLHRHSGQSERPARRAIHRQFRLLHGGRRQKDVPQALSRQFDSRFGAHPEHRGRGGNRSKAGRCIARGGVDPDPCAE